MQKYLELGLESTDPKSLDPDLDRRGSRGRRKHCSPGTGTTPELGGEEGEAARVRHGRAEGEGVLLNTGREQDGCHRTRGAMGWPPRSPRLL